MLRQTACWLRPAAFRRRCLSVANLRACTPLVRVNARMCSIGLRSGKQAGRKSNRASAALMAFRMAGALWLPGLSRVSRIRKQSGGRFPDERGHPCAGLRPEPALYRGKKPRH